MHFFCKKVCFFLVVSKKSSNFAADFENVRRRVANTSRKQLFN